MPAFMAGKRIYTVGQTGYLWYYEYGYIPNFSIMDIFVSKLQVLVQNPLSIMQHPSGFVTTALSLMEGRGLFQTEYACNKAILSTLLKDLQHDLPILLFMNHKEEKGS
jgi:hypothetical protein